MTRQGIRAFDRAELDFVVLEDIGNLVCPAEFDTGANFNLTILSVPEGDDKPAKYPLMYEVSDVLVITKSMHYLFLISEKTMLKHVQED